MQNTIQKYIAAFKNLRVDRAHGIAPHKPILLLSILQLVQQDQITDNRIFITPELVAQFKFNWSLLVTTNHECKFALPFYHLTSDKFWTLIPKPGFENILQLKSSMRSFSNLNAAIEYARIDNELWLLMSSNESNKILQNFLLDEYFPRTKNSFNKSGNNGYQMLDNIEKSILNESPGEYKKEIKLLIQKNEEEEIFLRGAIFKREVPRIYNNTCCISGMNIAATFSVAMVDACHIVPFSQSFDDTISNGICLCPNLHRAFDRGLITISEYFTVLVSNKFKEEDNIYSIRTFEGKQIMLPDSKDKTPSIRNLSWHKENVFKGN